MIWDGNLLSTCVIRGICIDSEIEIRGLDLFVHSVAFWVLSFAGALYSNVVEVRAMVLVAWRGWIASPA